MGETGGYVLGLGVIQYLGVKAHGCQAAATMAVLEIPFPTACVNVPHTNSAALIAADDLQQTTGRHTLVFCLGFSTPCSHIRPWAKGKFPFKHAGKGSYSPQR